MASLNRVYLMGNLARDVESHQTGKGFSVAEFTLAVSEKFPGQNGAEPREEVAFIPVVTFGKQADACSEYLAKGSAAHVEGKIVLEQWETEKGEKRSRIRVRADRVQFLGAPRRASQEEDNRPAPRATEPKARAMARA